MEQAAGTSRPTMQAVRLHGPGDARLESLPRLRTEDGRMLLRMRSVGLCESDVHQFREGSTDGTLLEEPLVPGHEIAAERSLPR